MKRYSGRSLSPAVLLLLSLASFAASATVQFNSTVYQKCIPACSLSDPALWIGNIVPGVGDDAVIDLSKISFSSLSNALNMQYNLQSQLNSLTIVALNVSTPSDAALQFILMSDLAVSRSIVFMGSNIEVDTNRHNITGASLQIYYSKFTTFNPSNTTASMIVDNFSSYGALLKMDCLVAVSDSFDVQGGQFSATELLNLQSP
eukprot:TRINITY_DN12296_c0_g1_i1.p1 TRINITY_DN12296_c0_g1~~TRINITY_DN12296_c0_g1_i1.p1  ORF type:complete len:203 (+),score=17.53 TRINITY_DN12296_c0_g1_i1:11-619(+)